MRRGTIILHMLTAEKKTLRVANQRIEVEAYNKALQEPDSDVMCRLELRSKKLYDDDAEAEKELRELDKWFTRLANATTLRCYYYANNGL